MPQQFYTEEEVEVYTRMLARAYAMIRDEDATEEVRHHMLKEIEKTLGWQGPPSVKAKPPSDTRFSRDGWNDYTEDQPSYRGAWRNGRA